MRHGGPDSLAPFDVVPPSVVESAKSIFDDLVGGHGLLNGPVAAAEEWLRSAIPKWPLP